MTNDSTDPRNAKGAPLPYEQRHYDLADRIIVTSLRKSAGVDAGPALRAAMAEELAKAEARGEAKAREAYEKNQD